MIYGEGFGVGAAKKMIADVERVVRGETPEEVVNSEVLPHWRARRR